MRDLFIPRDIASTVKRYSEVFPVVTITGPRQSGKTTLCRHMFPELPYVSMEDLEQRTRAQENPRLFLEQMVDGGIIDEIQVIPELLNALQVVVDEDKHAGRRRHFYITGSNNFALLNCISQSMAGRTGLLNLLPLSIAELTAAGFERTANEYMLSGGYPAVWDNQVEMRDVIINSYIETYVERDVRRLINVRDARAFLLFLKLCAGRIGSELNKSSISIELGVSVPTIDNWISILEASYVVFLLQPWYSNIGKRLTKTPKIYFYDTGLAALLMGIRTEEQLAIHPLRGALFENMALLEVVKSKLNRGEKADLYFYRDKSGREIDIIEEDGNWLDAIEVKSATRPDSSFFKNIDYLGKLLPERLRRRAVIFDGMDFELDGGREMLDFRNLHDTLR